MLALENQKSVRSFVEIDLDTPQRHRSLQESESAERYERQRLRENAAGDATTLQL
jgi:hypothetical protein